MADSVVSSTVTFALENLSRLLVDEVKLLSGVKDEISSLHNELMFMDKFLKNSEGKRSDELVKKVVSQIRDVTHQAEDVIDTYIVKVNKHKSRNMLGKCLHYKDHEMMLHEVNAHIQNIKVTIDTIYKNKARYGIGEGDFETRGHNTVEENGESLRRRRRDVEEEEVVGLVHDSTVVIEELEETDSCLNVISIIGMGGLGKTTLARKIYNNNNVKDIFPCRAWGFVSNDYRAREFFMSLLQCLGLPMNKHKDLSQEDMKKKVRECLTRKKYLVVLDDIWETQVWDEIQGAFPNDDIGSRILITSRKREIAWHTRSSIVHDLRILDKGQSWELFCKKVFNGKECPSELERLGREMAESCKGLPLAIIVLAGLVAKKDRSERVWSRIKDKLFALEDKTVATEILMLSYDDLPQKLKPCFLYLGIYPEDFEIPVRKLIQLWIAEGFIQREEIGTSNASKLEDIADYYLDELVDRRLVQVARRRTDGGVKTCRIHGLLRDLCISESKAIEFMEVCTESDIDERNPRRMSLHCKTKLEPTKYDQSHVRSLFLFGDELCWDSESKGWKWIRKRLNLARVLYLSSVLFASLPGDLKTLIHLRYLDIEARIKITHENFFASMCNLCSLETLYIIMGGSIYGDVVTLPSGMWKMKRLRHVYFDAGCLGLPLAHTSGGENSDSMLNLQTLGWVAVNPQIASALNNDSFPNLTKLTLLIKIGKSSPQAQLRSLHRLNKLRTLKIYGAGNSNLPLDANVFPSNLTKITLSLDLDSRFINTLGQLANLQILKLRHGGISSSVNCTAGEFPQLEVLHVVHFRVDWGWRQEIDAMPRLRHLNHDGTQYRDWEARVKMTNLQ